MADIQLPDGSTLAVPDDATPEQAQQYYQSAQQMASGKPASNPGLSPATSAPSGLGQEDMHGIVSGMIRSVLQSQVDQGKKAWNAIQGQGDFQGMNGLERTSSAIGHGLAALTPIVGPTAADLGDSIGNKDVMGSILNGLGLVGQAAGPEVMGAIGAPLRKAGSGLLDSILNLNPNMKTPLPEEVVNLFKEGGFKPNAEGLSRLSDYIGTNVQGAKGEIAKYGSAGANLQVPTADVLGPLLDKYKQMASIGNENLPQAKALLDEMTAYQKKWGGNVPLDKAQEIKTGLWKMFSDKQMQADLAQMPGAKQAMYLRATGLKDAIENVVGPSSDLSDFNHRAHVGITLYNALEDLAGKNPHWLEKAAPWVAGLGAGAAAYEATGASHSGLRDYAAGATAIPVTVALTKMAMKDPSTLTALGLVLAKAGEGPVASAISQLPRLMGAASFSSKAAGHAAPVLPQTHATPPIQAPTQDIPKMVHDAAMKEGIDPALALAVAQKESGFDPKAVSSKGAIGPMQLRPQTAKGLGVDDPTDIRQNIAGGVKYLHQMLDRYKGNVPTALAAYNAGPAIIDKGGDLPQETQDYISTILDRLQKSK